MFHWLSARFQKLVDWAEQKEIERLVAKGQRLEAEWRKANGDTPIRFTRSQRREIDEAFKGLDPEWVKQHTLFADAEIVEDDDE